MFRLTWKLNPIQNRPSAHTNGPYHSYIGGDIFKRYKRVAVNKSRRVLRVAVTHAHIRAALNISVTAYLYFKCYTHNNLCQRDS